MTNTECYLQTSAAVMPVGLKNTVMSDFKVKVHQSYALYNLFAFHYHFPCRGSFRFISQINMMDAQMGHHKALS